MPKNKERDEEHGIRPETPKETPKTESEPVAEIERVEAEVENVVAFIETASDPEGELTQDEMQEKRSLLRRVFDAPMDLLRFTYRQEMFEFVRAKHKNLSEVERNFRKKVFTAGEQQEGGDAIDKLIRNEPQLRDHAARLLLELFRNEDYYDTHETTEWECTQRILHHPYDPYNPQTHEKVSESKGMYQVFTTVRAKERSPYDSNYSSKTIYLGQIKATTPKLLRTLQLGENVEREWGGSDALEPIFGLPLPPSPIFKTRKEADAFAEIQRTLINEVAKTREGRIKIAQPVKVKRI